ncbi:hypothetical protein ENBRE01_0912 [Enteropsectra breve]|nr:hypothetical protein ENBRE01_0912 [Enteropsectra breve]
MMKIWQEIKNVFLAVLFSVLTANAFGIVNDMVTVRLCKEYFTQGFHKENVEGTWIEKTMELIDGNPNLIALLWGIIATWVVGVILGIVLAACMRMGSWPKYDARHLLIPLGLCFTALLASVTFVGFYFYDYVKNADISGVIYTVLSFCHKKESFSEEFLSNSQKMKMFIVCAEIHNSAYSFGGIYGILTSLSVLGWRYKKSRDLH